MTPHPSARTLLRNLLLIASIVAAIPSAWSADDAAPAANVPHRTIPTVSVSSDRESLAALVETLAPRLDELGCAGVPTASSSPRQKRHHHEEKHEGKHGAKMKHRAAGRDTAFYGCGGEDATQKLIGVAQDAAGAVLEKYPDALIQIGKVFVRPAAFLSLTCPTMCPTSSGLKPGIKTGGICFVCTAK